MNKTEETFKPTQAIALICGSYDIEIREQLTFVKFLGIRDLRKPEFTKQGLDEAFREIRSESIKASNHPTRKLFVYVFYGGHGAIYNGMTGILFNSKVEDEQFYPFEK